MLSGDGSLTLGFLAHDHLGLQSVCTPTKRRSERFGTIFCAPAHVARYCTTKPTTHGWKFGPDDT